MHACKNIEKQEWVGVGEDVEYTFEIWEQVCLHKCAQVAQHFFPHKDSSLILVLTSFYGWVKRKFPLENCTLNLTFWLFCS